MSENIRQATNPAPDDWKYERMTDEEITSVVEAAFIRMEQEEAGNEKQRQTLNPQQ